jgi:outer membrane protein assembly factor BamB
VILRDVATGKRLWQKGLPGRPVGPPYVAGSHAWFLLDGVFPGLVRADLLTGRLDHWSMERVMDYAVVHEGDLLLVSRHGRLVAYPRDALKPGGTLPEPSWEVSLPGPLRCRPLVVADSLLVVGTLNDSLVAYDLPRRQRVWAADAGGAVYGLTPAGPDRFLASLQEGRILLVGADGSAMATYAEAGALVNGAVTDGSLVVAASVGGDVTAWSVDGTRLWRTSLGQAIVADPILTATAVIVATRRGTVVGLSRDQGLRLWSLDLQGPLLTAPCVGPRRLVVAEGRGQVRAFQHAGGWVASVPRTTARRGVPARPDSGWISVSSQPPGRTATLDGRVVGATPLDSLRVPAGWHRVALRPEDPRIAWPPVAEEWVRVAPGEVQHVRLVPGREVLLETSPRGAMVALEDRVLGTTPLRLTFQPGLRLDLRARGYRDTVVTLPAEARTRLHVLLRPEGGRVSASGEAGQGSGWTRSFLRWGAPLLTLAAGAAAVYFRQEANDAYDAYLHTGQREAMERHLEEARRWDRWSVASWLAGEVFFGVTFFSWIRADEAAERAADLPGPEGASAPWGGGP